MKKKPSKVKFAITIILQILVYTFLPDLINRRMIILDGIISRLLIFTIIVLIVNIALYYIMKREYEDDVNRNS